MSVTIVYGTPEYPSAGVTPYRSLIKYTAPADYPITLAEAKTQCRVDTSDEDTYLNSLIAMATEYVENVLDISLISQTLEARYDCFPMWELILPRPPMASGTVTVIYRDEAGASQTITSATGAFQTDYHATPGRIYPLYQGVWPAVRGDENSVTVRWPAGYGASGASVPSTVKGLCLLLVAHWFEMRQPVVTGFSQVLPVPQTFETLLAASGWGGYR